jgi:hypothetical protein
MTNISINGWRVTVGEGVGVAKTRKVMPAGAKEASGEEWFIKGFESTKGGWEVPLDMQACLLEAND